MYLVKVLDPEEEFDTVSDWYENSQILSLFKTSSRIG